MDFTSELIEAKLVRRYKRFLADVIFLDGSPSTVYCPNPGSMLGLIEKGTKIWVQKAKNPKAKLPFVWKLVEREDGTLVCIDTQIANEIVFEALSRKKIPGLENYEKIISEPKMEDGSRLDFLVKSMDCESCFLEVKSVTLSRSFGLAEFPDSVTSRGAKHLRLLANLKSKGIRAIQLYVVQREDATYLKIAKDIDEAYQEAFEHAKRVGVEVLAFRSEITKKGIKLSVFSPSVL